MLRAAPNMMLYTYIFACPFFLRRGPFLCAWFSFKGTPNKDNHLFVWGAPKSHTRPYISIKLDGRFLWFPPCTRSRMSTNMCQTHLRNHARSRKWSSRTKTWQKSGRRWRGTQRSAASLSMHRWCCPVLICQYSWSIWACMC